MPKAKLNEVAKKYAEIYSNIESTPDKYGTVKQQTDYWVKEFLTNENCKLRLLVDGLVKNKKQYDEYELTRAQVKALKRLGFYTTPYGYTYTRIYLKASFWKKFSDWWENHFHIVIICAVCGPFIWFMIWAMIHTP